MRVVSFLCLSGAFLMPTQLAGPHARPCPPDRSLEQRFYAADIVVLGEVTYDRDCIGWSRSQSATEPDRVEIPDCFGRRADVRIEQVWKGDLKLGDTVGLVLRGPSDSAGVLWRTGERHLVFANGEFLGRLWWGSSDACKAPAGLTDRAAVAALNARKGSNAIVR
jgi:hypothetical protein